MNTPLVIPTAEPFLYTGNRIGCLLVHGFTGTPKEMFPIGEFLAQKGLTIMGIRLAGHATNMKDITRMQWQDWLANIEDGLSMLKNITDVQFIIGLSMGGILSLIASAFYPFEGAVIYSAPYDTPDSWQKKMLPVLKYLIRGVPKGPSDWQNPEAEKDHVCYPVYPTAAIPQYLAAQETMQKLLSQVKIPVLLIYSKMDKTATPSHMQSIYNQLGSTNKKMILLLSMLSFLWSGGMAPAAERKATPGQAAPVEKVFTGENRGGDGVGRGLNSAYPGTVVGLAKFLRSNLQAQAKCFC